MANGSSSPRPLHKPPVLDCSTTDVAAGDDVRAALASTLSPVVALEGHGLAARCAAVAAAASAAHGAGHGARQEAFALDGVADAAALKADLVALARRALAAVAPGFPADAALDARFSLRRYPATGDGRDAPRLGAHVDNTLCTLLWSTGPGLEVLAPRRDDAAWTAADVRSVGLPTMGSEPKVVGDGDWAAVDARAGAVLFTPGEEWTRCAHTRAAAPLRSPTLHRVVLPGDETRLSLPLLVSLANP